MLNLIDWKGTADIKKEIFITESEITPHFKNIFQSDNFKNQPKVDDISYLLDFYHIHMPNLDYMPNHLELNHALCKLGKDTGMDGIPANVLRMMPLGILNNLLSLIRKTFIDNYPKSWKRHILNAIPKPGHTPKNPKLRGIAVAPLFARVYDCILNRRFGEWYTPNLEQAGFRKGQSCLLQLFSIILFIHFSKKEKKRFDCWILGL